jgi:hypothetical protein
MQKITLLSYLLVTVFIIGFVSDTSAQRNKEYEDDADREADNYWAADGRKGLYAGIYLGAFFSNPYSARLYDGYGFDLDGNPNSFANSFMNRKINFELSNTAFGGDQVAEQLGVQPGEWNFDESDMPTNLKYNIAFAFGLQGRYHLNNNDVFLFNMNFMRLTVNGQYTITTTSSAPVGEFLPQNAIRTFGIRGEEQRIMFQIGYQRILGNNATFNWLIEAGVDLTLSKFERNEAQLGNLIIDLTTFYNQFGFQDIAARNLTGAAVGAFAGFGGQVEAGEKWVLQLVYNPLFQKVALGSDTKYGLHHSIGLRAIYQL